MIDGPGLYFGLPEAAYHAHPALSNSGIKSLMISPMDFWARCSWLNPNAEHEESPFMELGTAYDVRITEGRGAFYGRYAAALEPPEDALRTADDLRQALADLGLKRGGNKPEMIDRLIEANPALAANIWDLMEAEHRERHVGKALLAADQIRRIELAAAMIENHPQLSKAFTGGYPQVSIFWTCEETGCPMKMRADYLKTRAIVDLKTFSNPFGKSVDRAVVSAMANMRYHIQAAVYQEGVEAAKGMIRAMNGAAIHGEPEPAWVERFTAANEHAFLFVFQQTGIAPVARGYEMPRGLIFDCGKIAARQAKEAYLAHLERFGTDPWVDVTDVRAFDDTEFPVYMTME